MKRDSMLNIRLPAEVKAALQLAADADHGRSLSGMTVRILSEWLRENGYLDTREFTAIAERESAKRPGRRR